MYNHILHLVVIDWHVDSTYSVLFLNGSMHGLVSIPARIRSHTEDLQTALSTDGIYTLSNMKLHQLRAKLKALSFGKTVFIPITITQATDL